jgi:hypothetical protein
MSSRYANLAARWVMLTRQMGAVRKEDTLRKTARRTCIGGPQQRSAGISTTKTKRACFCIGMPWRRRLRTRGSISSRSQPLDLVGGSRSHFWAPVPRAKHNGANVRLSAKKSWVTSAGWVPQDAGEDRQEGQVPEVAARYFVVCSRS